MKKSHMLRVPYALAVHDYKEKKRINAVLDEHRTNVGKETEEFERRVARQFGKKYGLMVNSGSSANLLAFELLNFQKGSEIITPLLTFSTTVSPIIMKGLIPVFTDVEEGSYLIDSSEIEKLITKKTKAIMVPLLLGNVPNMKRLDSIARKYKLALIEDSCDTLGAKYLNKPTGSYSHVTTTSFFGSHIITAGGSGGMIMVNEKKWIDKLRLLRGWGRSSSTFRESENIKQRFSKTVGDISYDAKFIFEGVGYNFLPAEICAAFGNAQMDKLAGFRERRIRNFLYLYNFFKQFEQFFILPKQDSDTKTYWLAFPLTIRESAPFTRLEITTYLEKNNVQTRPIFTGNILKQPGFRTIRHKVIHKKKYVVDDIMRHGFVIGCHHGLEKKHLQKIEDLFNAFLNRY